MKTHKSFAHLTTSLISILLLLLVANGCSSTGPDSYSGPSFDSGFLGPGETFSFTFEEEGTVDYYCDNHEPDMTGQVIVSQGAEISGRDTVVMENIQFNPSNITVAPNTEIVWVNREDEGIDDHTVTSGTPSTDGGGYY